MKQLQPIIEKETQYLAIEREIKHYFDTVIYHPLQSMIDINVGQYFNSIDILPDSIRKGRIQYSKGKFYGKFNSKTSKELKLIGAKWNNVTKTFDLPFGNLPDTIRNLIMSAEAIFQKLHADILAHLDSISPEKTLQTFSFDTSYIKTLTDLDSQAYETLKKDVSIVPELTAEMKEVIAQEYSTNLKLYIKDFTEKQIIKLREQVYANTFEGGYNAQNIVKMIQKDYEVSRNKAQFLAKQETSLLVSNYRQERYKSIGVTHYKWSSSHDTRVRPLHKHLNGQVFDWENPPIIDERTGEKGLPGQAFGCRCLAIGLID